MKVILINNEHSGARFLELGRKTRAVLSLCFLGLPLSMVGLGYFVAQLAPTTVEQDINLGAMQDELEQQSEAVAELRAASQRKLQALTRSAAELEARLLRLDALGQRLTDLAGLEQGEFDFGTKPALGGPLLRNEENAPVRYDLGAELEELENRVIDREQQLEMLQALLLNRQFSDDIYLSGRPIKKGWMSSPFGRRTDPFTGRSAWHAGVDFAGKDGSDIVAVAAGVVIWSGERSGYGDMVEVNHGSGYSTLYAHNKLNLVKVGDLVKKGEVIAEMGSSGRSTGPHVHYEVYKHGRPVDPASYIHRSRR
jgi:murein DD-endopeptidase MepM/ murein hydrolase activator NlpD